MEVYIDNQKTNFGRRSNDLEKILKAISKKLEKHEKVIQNIYINGSNIQDSIILDIDMDRPNIMEVETKSYTDLILDSLTISKEYIDTYFEVKEDFQQLIEDNEKISPIEIQETMETFREELITLDELKEKKDCVAYVSTLDYCITDILENFKTNIDYYYKSILEEVEQKKIVF